MHCSGTTEKGVSANKSFHVPTLTRTPHMVGFDWLTFHPGSRGQVFPPMSRQYLRQTRYIGSGLPLSWRTHRLSQPLSIAGAMVDPLSAESPPGKCATINPIF